MSPSPSATSNAAARFYRSRASWRTLGLSRVVTRPATIGFGKKYPEFWINLRAGMKRLPPESGVHICLRAKSTDEVDAFHAAALNCRRQRSDGAPGLRPHDRVRYYAAFVHDPDGNRIEAVTFPTQVTRQSPSARPRAPSSWRLPKRGSAAACSIGRISATRSARMIDG
jgi:catechol 2,3-dioxygenase-like lactoylglutathione lyase family enzyme